MQARLDELLQGEGAADQRPEVGGSQPQEAEGERGKAATAVADVADRPGLESREENETQPPTT